MKEMKNMKKRRVLVVYDFDCTVTREHSQKEENKFAYYSMPFVLGNLDFKKIKYSDKYNNYVKEKISDSSVSGEIDEAVKNNIKPNLAEAFRAQMAAGQKIVILTQNSYKPGIGEYLRLAGLLADDINKIDIKCSKTEEELEMSSSEYKKSSLEEIINENKKYSDIYFFDDDVEVINAISQANEDNYFGKAVTAVLAKGDDILVKALNCTELTLKPRKSEESPEMLEEETSSEDTEAKKCCSCNVF